MKKTFIFFIAIIVLFLTIAVLSNSNIDLSRMSASVTSAINNNTYGKIHFINVSNGTNVNGDAIVLESQGHLCLIDTGNPTQLVSKYTGKTYNYPNSDGVKVVDYIKNKIGGTKLDCILITHNHTDHNGGFKAVADSGLITSSTKFYYREFDNNNDKYKADNQAYYNIAKTAATKKGATLVNVNNATNVTFSVGNFNVKLLNTESWANRGHTGVTSEENNNSIVEYITINGRSILLTGDLEYVDETRLINNRSIGKVNILKLGHHGLYTSTGFNFIDTTNPDLVVISGNANYYPKERNIPAIKYLKDKYGKDVYYTSKVQDAIVIDFTNTTYTIHDYNTSNPISNARPVLTYTKSGVWTKVAQENNADRYAWYIFNSDGTTKTGWQKVGNYWYYFFTGNGAMQTGWKKESGYRYYLNNNLNSSFPEGAALTGWQTISGNKYYFAKSPTSSFKEASAYTGVQTIDGKNYLFNANSGSTEGALIKGWLKVGDAYFHSDNDGVVQTGWQKINGSWYFLDTGSSPKGKMATGFRLIANKWYYFKSNGVMIDNTCETVGNNQYCAKSGGELKNFTGKVAKPTTAICKSITYNGSQQLITSNPSTGVTYSNNNVTNAGLHTVHAKVASNYAWSDSTAGTVDIPCYINPKSVSSITVTASNQAYTGAALTPAPTVKDGTKTLTNGTDYTVTYANNVNVGTATVTITGKGNYKGSKNTTFAISSKNISGVTATVSNQTYTGKALTPVPTVKYGTKALTNGTDFTLSYSNNINIGTATITITGKGNYTGTKVVTFSIVAPPATPVAVPTSSYCKTLTYNGSAQTLTTNPGIGYTFSNNVQTNAGTYTVTATLKANYKWNNGSSSPATFSCVINQKSLSSLNITIENQLYTGSALTPEPVLKDGTKTLVKGTDYNIVSYENNTNVGPAKVNITGLGNYKDSISKTFEIISQESTFYFVDSSYMGLNNNKLNTILKPGVKSLTKSNFMNNIRSTDTWKLYNKNNNEVTSDSTLVTTGSSIRNNNTEYKIVIYGDIDQDGTITVKDLYQSFLLYKNKPLSINEYQRAAADYDKSGSINIIDVYQIYKKIKE